MLKMTGRWLRPFRRLQWRLTISYVLVAVVAMLTLALATAVLAAVTLQAKPSSAKYADKGAIQLMSLGIAPYLAPYLEQRSPDIVDLQRQLASMLAPRFRAKIDASILAYDQPSILIVLGRGNLLLASASTDSRNLPQGSSVMSRCKWPSRTLGRATNTQSIW